MARTEKVKALEALGKQFGCAQVVALFIDSDGGTLTTASWGRNKYECEQAKELGSHLHDEAMFYFQRRLQFGILGSEEAEDERA